MIEVATYYKVQASFLRGEFLKKVLNFHACKNSNWKLHIKTKGQNTPKLCFTIFLSCFLNRNWCAFWTWFIIDYCKGNFYTLLPTAHSHNTYLWSEELHHSNLSIHAHFLDGPQPLCSDHIDLQPRVFCYEQVEVLRRGEVTCRRTNIYNMLITLLFRREWRRKTWRKVDKYQQCFWRSILTTSKIQIFLTKHFYWYCGNIWGMIIGISKIYLD